MRFRHEKPKCPLFTALFVRLHTWVHLHTRRHDHRRTWLAGRSWLSDRLGIPISQLRHPIRHRYRYHPLRKWDGAERNPLGKVDVYKYQLLCPIISVRYRRFFFQVSGPCGKVHFLSNRNSSASLIKLATFTPVCTRAQVQWQQRQQQPHRQRHWRPQCTEPNAHRLAWQRTFV